MLSIEKIQIRFERGWKHYAASKSVHHIKPYESFTAYARYITENSNPNALIITESIGKQATSLRFTHEVLAPYCNILDVAILGARAQPLPELKKIAVPYTAGAWSGPLTNLEANPDISRGDASGTAKYDIPGIGSSCIRKDGDLALEWAEHRDYRSQLACKYTIIIIDRAPAARFGAARALLAERSKDALSSSLER